MKAESTTTSVPDGSAPPPTSAARASAAMRARTSGGSLRRASTRIGPPREAAGRTRWRKSDQNPSTSDGRPRVSRKIVRAERTSRSSTVTSTAGSPSSARARSAT